MKMAKILLLVLLIINSMTAFAGHKVFDTSQDTYIDYQQFITNLPEKFNLILGEYHYTPSIQKMQAQIINDVVLDKNLTGQFTVAWEFLNFIDQKNIDTTMELFKDGNISEKILLEKLFYESSNPLNNTPYLPILKVTKKLDGHLRGVNTPRKIKRIIIKKGLDAIDPIYIPPKFKLGGEKYFKRFKKSLMPHIPPQMVKRYFLAQCYTDSVMAYHLSHNNLSDVSFLIVGSFHSDYFDGVTIKSKEYSDLDSVSVKIVDTSEMSQEEIDQLLIPSPEFGRLADYIFLVE